MQESKWSKISRRQMSVQYKHLSANGWGMLMLALDIYGTETAKVTKVSWC